MSPRHREPFGKLVRLTAVVLLLTLGACSSTSEGSEPTRAQVQAGFEEIVLNGLGQVDAKISDKDLHSYASCLVDETFDDLSSAGKQALAAKNFEKSVSEQDQQVVSEASATCAASIADAATPTK